MQFARAAKCPNCKDRDGALQRARVCVNHHIAQCKMLIDNRMHEESRTILRIT